MKPLGIKNYGHIPHLPGSRLGTGDHTCNPGQAKIATKKLRDRRDQVIVQEKLDGSNVGVALLDGKLYPLIRSGYVANASPYEQHQYFYQWVWLHEDRFRSVLKNGERLIGEWLLQAHGTRYHLTHEPFVAFDVMQAGRRVNYEEFCDRLAPTFTIPRLIHQGEAFAIDQALTALSTSGHGAIDPVEGAIWRIERDGKFDFLCKFVRHDKQDGCYLPETYGQIVWNVEPKSILAISAN
ncbi:RNA ligase family protein [Phormidesmis sp. 146-35]